MAEVTIKVGLQPADYFWLIFIFAGLVFEFISKDLLTYSTQRQVKRHPILTRVGILALAGHLAVVLPHYVDVFSDKNLFHRGVAYSYRRVEAKCLGR